MTIPVSYSFDFQAQELPQKLSQISGENLTGYWLCEFSVANQTHTINPLYLALSHGRIIFSGNQKLSYQDFSSLLQQYIPRLRYQDAKQTIDEFEQQLTLQGREPEFEPIFALLTQLHQLELVTLPQVIQALRLKILSDFDHYLFDYSGQATFLSVVPSCTSAPDISFELAELLYESQQRQTLWHKLKAQIPSMDYIPVLNLEAVHHSKLSIDQKQRLESLVQDGKPLRDIASFLAQDPLEIAKGFAQLIDSGLITLQSSTNSAAPEIVIVDDSPLILKQFKNLVTHWGYHVTVCQNPLTALRTLLCSRPAVVFLDINMPGINGFDLVKQIRRHPQLTPVPLIMLTAEKTLTNNWRAQWSGCRFLTKPLSPQEVPQFQIELRMLLEDLAPRRS